MEGLWEKTFTWVEDRRRRQDSTDSTDSAVDIELEAPCWVPKRVDSAISLENSTFTGEHHDHSRPERVHEPIYLNLDFGDVQCVKLLEYGTFSRWKAVEQLLSNLERDGMVLEDLWDVDERMRVQSGDWDARVRPGWDLHCRCQSMRGYPEQGQEDDSRSEDADEGWLDEVLDGYQEEWCLPRWRRRVEAEQASGKVKEPSWKVLGLGCFSMLFFIVAVLAYTA